MSAGIDVPRLGRASLAAACLSILPLPADTGAAAAPPAAEVIDYSVQLTLDFKQQTVAGEEAITIRTPAGGQPTVDLAAADLQVEELTDGTEGGEHPAFDQLAGRLRFKLRRPAAEGEIHRVTLRYSGKPSRGLRFAAGQAFTAFHTQHWLVCQDDPAAKASLTLALVVPAGLDAVASGRRVGRDELADGRVRFRFRQDRPYSTYLFGFAVGSFRQATVQAGRVSLHLLSPTLTPEELRIAFRTTPEMLDLFATRAGVPYPGDSYTQVLLPDAPAQEMADLALMSDQYGRSALEDPREDYLIAHELAHQWWGNLVTCRTWSDFWLNEGMATFMVAVFKERYWGPDEYDREMAIARLRYENALAKGQVRALVYSGWSTPEEMGGPITYSRGALVLHLLRRQLGDDAFWKGVSAFTRAGAGGSVDSEDLRRSLERASGQDLRRFFAQWVYGRPPDLVAHHRLTNGGVDVEIEQRQPEPWTFPLEIAVASPTQRISRRITVTRRREVFHFALDPPVLSVAVDAPGDLPDPVVHERPLAMLVYQLAAEPAVAARIDALRALERACAPSVPERPAACTSALAALARAAELDAMRLVRQLAAQTLARLSPAGATP